LRESILLNTENGAQAMFTYKQFVGCGLMIALSIGWMGCGSSSSSGGSAGGGTSMDAMARQIDAQNAARKQQETAAATKATADQNAVAAQPPAEPERKAVGSRAAVAGGGYYGAIMGARRHVMNVVDNLSWIQGVRSFKAEEGRKPKDNDEFMNVVVKKYELQLPRIEEDEEYVYDPNGESDGDFGQLYVVKKEPAKQ
jgi:hypothetical protein